jgi:Mg2+/Co2+ transporter CorC
LNLKYDILVFKFAFTCNLYRYNEDKKVMDVMTTLDKVFMVESHTRLTFQVLMDIYKSGFTRIPVYEIDRQNIVGILFTKDLILIDPDDEVEIAAVISFHGNREGGFVRGVPDDTSLDKVFREVGLYKFNSVYPWLESAWFQPLIEPMK